MKFRKICFSILAFMIINTIGNIVSSHDLNLRDSLVLYFEGVSQGIEDISNEWKKVDIKYKNVISDNQLYEALQKGIYLGLFPNESVSLPLESDASQELLVKIVKGESNIVLPYTAGKLASPEWIVDIVKKTLSSIAKHQDVNGQIKNDILFNMKNYFLYKDEIDRDNLKCDSITGCTEIWKDDYSQYIESEKASSFKEELEGNFEGIGAYIKMVDTGSFIIESVIPGGPAEKGGLKSGDMFLQIDDNEINKKTSIYDLRNWIKGPSNSFVKIKIKRGNENLLFNIYRGIVIIPNVTYKKIKGDACYMKIQQFNDLTLQQFQLGLKYFQDKKCSTYIFDLRDNPGGNLEIVTNMLNYFIDGGKTIIEMKYANSSEYIVANNDNPKVSGKNIMLLVNGSTASASEIFAGVLCDYIENCQIIGQNTYGKGTAQSLIEYVDGSILKFTIAKRYTGKSKTSVDGKGLKPTIFVTDDKIDLFLKSLETR